MIIPVANYKHVRFMSVREYVLDCNEKMVAADLRGLNLDHADLSGLCLRNADFRGTSLNSANLKNSDLSFVSFRGANLKNAKLDGAKFFETNVADTVIDLPNVRVQKIEGHVFATDSSIPEPKPIFSNSSI